MLQRSLCRRHGRLTYPLGHGVRLEVGKGLLAMEPSNHIYYDPPKLRHQLDRDGYLLFKNKVPRPVIDRALDDVGDQMMANGWTSEAAREEQVQRNGFALGIPMPSAFRGDPIYTGPSGHDGAPLSEDGLPYGPSALVARRAALPEATAGFALTENIRQALCGSNVMTVVRQVFGGGTTLLPHYELEMAPPGEAHGFHAQSTLASRGTKLLLCAWVPLHDMPLSGGPLAVVRGSNSEEAYKAVRTTYGQYDLEAGTIGGDGCLTHHCEHLLPMGKTQQRDAHTGQLIEVDRCPLVSTAFEAGDIVLTTVYTLRAFLTNTTDTWRISGSTTWMMDGDDVGPDPRYNGEGSTGVAAWVANRHDPKRYPKTMAAARKEWGILSSSSSL